MLMQQAEGLGYHAAAAFESIEAMKKELKVGSHTEHIFE